MKNKKVLTFFLFVFFIFIVPCAVSYAYWVWSPEEGRFVNPDENVEDPAEAHFEYAMQLYKEKKIKETVQELQDLLKKHRGTKVAAEAQYYLGVIYEERGDYSEAVDAYKNLISSYPQSDRVEEVLEREFRIGNLFLSGRKAKFMGLEVVPSNSKAIAVFEHILKHAPYSRYGDQAQFRLGLAHKKAGNFSEALDAFQALIDNYPQSELVAEARFQLADTSFLRSGASARDERAMASASEYAESFLARYPDSEASEKAAKIQQQIDEKNAEKNYRIGAYYEKTNYLSSALIYYKDVAARYPGTAWGKKAAEKIDSLEQPVAFLKDQNEKILGEIQLLEAELNETPKDDAGRGALERKVERLKEKQKLLEKSKSESLKSREQDLTRREREWKEKVKKLDAKKKLLQTNTSEDFKRAIDRWQASLDSERDAIDREKAELGEWKSSLGIKDRGDLIEMIPFLGEGPTELEKIRKIDAKQLYKISKSKKEIFAEKELLYKQESEVVLLLKSAESERVVAEMDYQELSEALAAGGAEMRERGELLKTFRDEMQALEKSLKDRETSFEKQYGHSRLSGILRASSKAVMAPAGILGKSIEVMNPFDGGRKSLEEKTSEELRELEIHAKEKTETQRNLVEILSQRFNEELARQEQSRLLAMLDEGKKTDVQELRRSIKSVEKEIRGQYRDIADRYARNKELVKELNGILKTRDAQGAGAARLAGKVTSPVRLAARAGRDFILGRPTAEARAVRQAGDMAASGEDNLTMRAGEIKEEMELNGLVIEAKNREIFHLKKELEILKATASLEGGYKFRSSMVEVPHQFLEEAVESAQRLIPRKGREEVLIKRIDRETRDLAAAEEELEAIQAVLYARGDEPETRLDSAGAFAGEASAEREELEKEILDLREKVEVKRRQYLNQKALLEKEISILKKETQMTAGLSERAKQGDRLKSREEKLGLELESLHRDLAGLISREKELDHSEISILTKRINRIDQVVQKGASKAVAADLLRERQRMEERLHQIDARQDFLARETERFVAR